MYPTPLRHLSELAEEAADPVDVPELAAAGEGEASDEGEDELELLGEGETGFSLPCAASVCCTLSIEVVGVNLPAPDCES